MTEEARDSMVFARMRPQDVKLLREVAYARGEGVSSFIRRAVRRELAELSYLSDADKKALGVTRLARGDS